MTRADLQRLADEDLLGTTGWHLDRVADLLFEQTG